MTSAEEREKLPVSGCENVQPWVLSLMLSVNCEPLHDVHAVRESPGFTVLGSVTEGLGYISYQA